MRNKVLVVLFGFFLLTGCSILQETTRVVLGTSIRAMQKARPSASKKTYTCSFDECYEAVLNLSVEKKSYNTDDDENYQSKGIYDIYLKNPIKGYVVVMGIEGNIDTTEVGIFFVELGMNTVRLEVSSASPTARIKVATTLFKELDATFTSLIND